MSHVSRFGSSSTSVSLPFCFKMHKSYSNSVGDSFYIHFFLLIFFSQT